MSNYDTINLQDAAFFSALAYAPTSMNAIMWGLSQSGVDSQSAQFLTSGEPWSDDTTSLLN